MTTQKHKPLIIRLHGRKLRLSEFCRIYQLPYATARRYYLKGYHDDELLQKMLSIRYGNYKFGNLKFKTKRQFANYLNISVTTLNKYLNQGRVDKLLEFAKENSTKSN